MTVFLSNFLLLLIDGRMANCINKSVMDLTSIHTRFSSVVRSAAESLTFLEGPPEWKWGLRISFAKASKSTLRVFRIEVIGVIRWIQRPRFFSGCACASAQILWTSCTGSIDFSRRTNATAKFSFDCFLQTCHLELTYHTGHPVWWPGIVEAYLTQASCLRPLFWFVLRYHRHQRLILRLYHGRWSPRRSIMS